MHVRLDVTGIDGLAKKLVSLGENAKGAVYDMLIAGSDIVIDELKKSATDMRHTPKTGDMIGSIQRKAEPSVHDNGGSVTVTMEGSNKFGTRYAEIGAYLNYGTSKITGDHWFDNGADNALPKAEKAMKNVLDGYLNA